MNDIKTSWTTATDNIQKALASVTDCIERGMNAWIEVRDNTDPDIAFPITIPNPALDNPFNWKSTYGTFRTCTQKKVLLQRY